MRDLTTIHAISLAIILAFAVEDISSAERPNIIFILADDLGWDDVSFHGSRQIPTPNLDALAYDGILLSNYYVQPICTPTRGALLTGRHPIHLGLQHDVIMSSQPYGLGLNETILPQLLKQLGYSTHIVGKWHLGMFAKEYTPTYRGFDSHFGYYQGCEDYYIHTYAAGGLHETKQWGLDFRRNMKMVRNAYGQYATELYANEAEQIIAKHDTKQPLFLYLPHQAVHSGLQIDKISLEAPWKYVKKFGYIRDEQRRTFAGMVSALDDAVRKVIKALRDKNMLENSVVIFSTDNGGPPAGFDYNRASNWPLRGTKNSLWEGGVRGAGFIWSPFLKKSGYTSGHMMQVIDWLPTILHAAGYDMAKLPSNIDGLDQWDVLSEDKESVRKEILHNIDDIAHIWALRVGDWKILSGLGNVAGWTGWYPPKQVTNDESKETNFLQEEIETAPKELFDNDMIDLLRDLGRPERKERPFVVRCGRKPKNATTNCKPVKSPCLFNIHDDPCEFNNMADKFRNIVKRMLERLHVYNSTAVLPRNTPVDPKGFPYYHNGDWVPWINLTEHDLQRMGYKPEL